MRIFKKSADSPKATGAMRAPSRGAGAGVDHLPMSRFKKLLVKLKMFLLKRKARKATSRVTDAGHTAAAPVRGRRGTMKRTIGGRAVSTKTRSKKPQH